MSPLILLLLVLATAFVLQTVVRTLLPSRRWVTTGRPRLALARRRALSRRTMMARRSMPADVPSHIGAAAWENEGGSVDTSVGPKAT
jgi:hypothetical protein